MRTDFSELRDDPVIRAYVFDFVSKGFLLGLTDKFEVTEVDRVKFQKQYYETLHQLSILVEARVGPNDVLKIIEQVGTYYLDQIGRIGFEQYSPQHR